MTITLADLARQAAERLRARLTPDQNAALDAELLARHVLGWDQVRWIAESRSVPPAGFAEAFEGLIARRLRFEPVAYIVGSREFFGLDFTVTPDVLIPRPCTEALVEQSLPIIDRGARRIADVGTGSGCIAIALALARPDVHVFATDVSAAALDVARGNAARHGVSDRIDFIETSLLDGVPAVDLVVSNPPYIGHRHRLSTMPEVWGYEPLMALFSGDDGLDVIRALLGAVRHRHPVPALLFEFGGPVEPIRAAVEDGGLVLTGITPDLAGEPRVAHVKA